MLVTAGAACADDVDLSEALPPTEVFCEDPDLAIEGAFEVCGVSHVELDDGHVEVYEDGLEQDGFDPDVLGHFHDAGVEVDGLRDAIEQTLDEVGIDTHTWGVRRSTDRVVLGVSVDESKIAVELCEALADLVDTEVGDDDVAIELYDLNETGEPRVVRYPGGTCQAA